MKTHLRIKRTVTALLAGLMIITTTIGTYAQVSPAKSVSAASKKNDKFEWPKGPSASKLSCDSAIVMEVSTGSILYKRNIHKQHYPASITKILTALLAIENSSLSDTVNFSEAAVYGIERGSSTIYTEVGEKLSMEQCLYAIALESANEVCLGAAEHVAGSISSFVDMMNKRVKQLGLKDTHFNNPNGLPDPKHYTSAYDMAVIARTAAQNSTFRKIFNTKSYVCAKTNKHKMLRYWNNHHQMINGYQYPQYQYKYCTGGKTGFTQISKSTLVTFAEKDGMQLVCVIMKSGSPKNGEPNEYTDTISLLNFGFANYKKYHLNEENSSINTNLFNNYDNFFNPSKAPIHLSNESAVVLPKGVKVKDITQTISYKKGIKLNKGENIIGKVKYTFAGKNVGSTDIIYDNNETTHLDEASRQIVNSEIQEIESDNEKQANNKNIFSKIFNPVSSAFGQIADLIEQYIIIFAIAVIILMIIIIMVVRKKKASNVKSQREKRKEAINLSNKRRNHNKRYEKNNQSDIDDTSTNRRGRRAKTTETFGRNYYNYK